MKFAIKLCMKSDMRYKLSAIIYDNKGRVINSDYNRWLRIGKDRFRSSIHAEQGAIIGCSRSELWGSSIFVYRKNGRMAKPCPICMSMILDSGIRNVFWSSDNGEIDKW